MNSVKDLALKIYNGTNTFETFTPQIYKIPTGAYDSRDNEIKDFLNTIDAKIRSHTTNISKDGIHAYTMYTNVILSFDRKKLEEFVDNVI